MKQKLLWRTLLVVAILLVAGYYINWTVRLAMLSPSEKEALGKYEVSKLEKKSVNLGLDLKGGMHLVLEVDRSKAKLADEEDPIGKAIEIIRNRVDEFGVGEPLIQKAGADRIIVELPGLQDPQRAKDIIGRTAMLEFKIVREAKDYPIVMDRLDKALKSHNLDTREKLQAYIVARAGRDTLKADSLAPVDTAAAALLAQLEKTNATKKDTASTTKDTSSNVFGETKKDTADSLGGQKGLIYELMPIAGGDQFEIDETDLPLVRTMLNLPFVANAIPQDAQIRFEPTAVAYQGGKAYRAYLLNSKAEVVGKDLQSAKVQPGNASDPETAGMLIVSMKFTRDGTRRFANVTGGNKGRRLAIVLDDRVHSAPSIKDKIREGGAIITGIQNPQEAKDIALVLNAGALPVPLVQVEERTIGPTLGADSIRSGIAAAVLGLIVVILFMVIYYKGSGAVAVCALFLNLFILLAAMSGLKSTLTLPGIAGIILTIGMAVDANVLIFERVREELRHGKTVRASLDAGYEKAFTTILDSNLTTMITAIILYIFGTGPVKGFAVTLTLGIAISMFTAIFVTRLIFNLVLRGRTVESLSI